MSKYEEVKRELLANPKRWLVTGVAGFIGSNLLETLLLLNQSVVGLDNFSTGKKANLDEVIQSVSGEQWNQFKFIEGDIRSEETCRNAVRDMDYVLHQAALGSVPRSIADPLTTNSANITGFLNILHAAKEANVESFTYAASSSTYGDHPALPKVEENIGKPLSPYAVTKYVNELYADVFMRAYGFAAIGLRYFNVFGKRQNPNGPYAAVIPTWAAAMLEGQSVSINGDGQTSRDFCFIANVVQANILAATASEAKKNQIYNVALGDRTTLSELFKLIKFSLKDNGVHYMKDPVFKDFRPGDVRHSQADISKIKDSLGYEPSHNISDGVSEAMPWYVGTLS